MFALMIGLVLAWQSLPAQVLVEWNKRFENHSGWIGGDGAYSVALSPTKTVWLFSDTWVGEIKDGKRFGATIVNNTAAIESIKSGKHQLQFFIRRDAAGKPQALITPQDGQGWFWLFAGTCVQEKLYLFLAQIERSDGKGVFSFKQTGQWLGIVDNPSDEPTAWKVRQCRLPFVRFEPDHQLSFGSSILQHGETIYIYGFAERPKSLPRHRHLVLARVRGNRLDNFAAWEFFCENGWQSIPEQLKPLVPNMACEFSVHESSKGKFVLVYTEHSLSDKILLRTAVRPEGPWSKPREVYHCPEMKQDKQLFCYAAKAHPHLSSANELVITYVVNSFDFWQVARDATLYWPRFIRVRLDP